MPADEIHLPVDSCDKYPHELSGGCVSVALFELTFSGTSSSLGWAFDLDEMTKMKLHAWYLEILNSCNIS